MYRQEQSQPAVKAEAPSASLPWLLENRLYTQIDQGFQLNCKTLQEPEPVLLFISLQCPGENVFLGYTVNLGIRNSLQISTK